MTKNLAKDRLKRKRWMYANILQRIQRSKECLMGVFTEDENLRSLYDSLILEKRMEWKSWGPPSPKRALMSESKFERISISLFFRKSKVHRGFVSRGQADNQMFYLQVLERFRWLICRMWPAFSPDYSILQHHDVPSSIALSVKKVMTRDWTMILKHLACSLGLVIWDSLVFHTRKSHLKASHCESVEEIQKVKTAALNKLQEKDSLSCFGTWDRSGIHI
jgi:hypothetical protein